MLGRPESGLPPCSSRNGNRYGPLLSLISPPRHAVLLSRPPQPLLEQPPKRTIFYVLLSRRKLSKCLLSPFCGTCGGIPGFTQNHQKTAAEPRYMTFEDQTFLPFLFSFFLSFISLIADGPHHYHPACGHKGSSHLSPVHALQFFYRDASSALLQLVNQ